MFVGCMWASEYVELLPTLGLPDTGTNVSTGAHMAGFLASWLPPAAWLAGCLSVLGDELLCDDAHTCDVAAAAAAALRWAPGPAPASME